MVTHPPRLGGHGPPSPHENGGFGITPNTIPRTAAYYTTTARFVAFVGSLPSANQLIWIPDDLTTCSRRAVLPVPVRRAQSHERAPTPPASPALTLRIGRTSAGANLAHPAQLRTQRYFLSHRNGNAQLNSPPTQHTHGGSKPFSMGTEPSSRPKYAPRFLTRSATMASSVRSITAT
jgi:hypothetical protein